jgi:phosphatidylglycerol---prolipoprotein diacylglyceryl transferase
VVINIDPVLLYIGGQPIVRWYGLMYVVGILVGLTVCIPFARTRGLSEDDIWSVFWPAAVGGLLGARLYYVAQSDPLSYLSQPWRILATWEGGMAFYGAIFGAAIGLIIAARRYHLSVWALLDAGAILATIGQAFGRIGNIINGDVVGFPTDLPWGFIYVHPNSFVAQKGIAYQPAAVYELIFNILLFVLLWKLKGRLKSPGTVFTTWLVTYSVGQILIFTTRMNDVVLMGLKQAQVTAIVVIIACIPLMWFLQGREPAAAVDAPNDADSEEAY